MANLNAEQLRRLARLGAVARLTQLKEEEAAIREEFPELFGHVPPKPARGKGGRQRAMLTSEDGGGANGEARGTRRPMSAAERKAVSVRMRKYWAERRKAKGSK